MIPRILSKKLQSLALKFPVVSVVGPRQSGKTTLVKKVFSGLSYVSLEDLDAREFALKDPKGFLATHNKGVIIDEAQRAPDIFSYIQTVVDTKKAAGQFILTGSQNILLHERVSQTLAGRVAILKLLPFSLEELENTPYRLRDIDDYIFKGFYPRIYDKRIKPSDWYSNYIQTYVERDVRLIKNIGDLSTFQKFVKLCAGRIGQIVNLSSLGNECGVTHNTAKAWLSILESCYIIFLLRPYYKNFNKRLIKMPKLYFYDSGLASSLLGIHTRNQLATHYMRGSLFESALISELIKESYNMGKEPKCYFWRDKTGNEVDCIIETERGLGAIEIKSGKTITSDFFNGLSYWKKVSGNSGKMLYLVYGGVENQKRANVNVLSWRSVSTIIHK